MSLQICNLVLKSKKKVGCQSDLFMFGSYLKKVPAYATKTENLKNETYFYSISSLLSF